MTDRTIHFLALGDSYTAGTGVRQEQAWPFQAVRALRERGLPVSPPRVIAGHGWTTADLLEALGDPELPDHWDLISLLIGVNDHYQGDPPALYRARFRTLLDWALDRSGTGPEGVLVLSIPDWSITPYAADRDSSRIRRSLKVFNQINRDLAKAAGCPYLDITPLSLKASLQPEGLVEDGLHPSAWQYARWTESIVLHLEGILASSGGTCILEEPDA